MAETWEDVVDWPYEISSNGRVRAKRTGRILSSHPTDRYDSVVLNKGGKRKRILVHKLVLETFVGPRPTGHVANHKNGGKRDNRVENLEWVTQRRNVGHAYEHRLRPVGEAHHKAKLTEQQVREIRTSGWTPVNHPRKDVSSTKLARKYGVSHPTIQAILRGHTWRHLL